MRWSCTPSFLDSSDAPAAPRDSDRGVEVRCRCRRRAPSPCLAQPCHRGIACRLSQVLDPPELRYQGQRWWQGPAPVLAPPWRIVGLNPGFWQLLSPRWTLPGTGFHVQLLSSSPPRFSSGIRSSTGGRDGGVQPAEGTASLQAWQVGTREGDDDPPDGTWHRMTLKKSQSHPTALLLFWGRGRKASVQSKFLQALFSSFN